MTENQEIFGNVIKISLGGKELRLSPTLACCMMLSRAPGLEVLRQRVVSYDLEAMVMVVAAGIGQNAKEIAPSILKAGMTNIMPSLNEVLVGIARGGLTSAPEGDDKGEALAGS